MLTNVAFFLVFAAVYFIPTWIALRRHHRSAIAVMMVNIFTGWTVAGWVVALGWAIIGDREDDAWTPPTGDPSSETR